VLVADGKRSRAVDPRLVPDEWLLIDHFREALAELHAVVAR
jgi:hypothetical protein